VVWMVWCVDTRELHRGAGGDPAPAEGKDLRGAEAADIDGMLDESRGLVARCRGNVASTSPERQRTRHSILYRILSYYL